MKKLTRNQMKSEIRRMKEYLPDGEFKKGLYIKKICNKHVQIINVHLSSKTENIGIEEFYSCYV